MRASPYNQALSLLREQHREQFEAILVGLTEETGRRRCDLHTPAMSRLRLEHQDEYRRLVDQCKAEVEGRPVSLTRRVAMPARRKEMDPMDAMILYGRGLSLAQIATYDRCTQTAVLAALLPQLNVNRRKGRPLGGRRDSQSVLSLAERLKADPQLLHRALAPA